MPDHERPRRSLEFAHPINVRDVRGDPELERELASRGVEIVISGQKRERWRFRCPGCGVPCATIHLLDGRLVCWRCTVWGDDPEERQKRDRMRKRARSIYRRINVNLAWWPRVPGRKPRSMTDGDYWMWYSKAKLLEEEANRARRPRLRRIRFRTRTMP